jgi:hypothetical protein
MQKIKIYGLLVCMSFFLCSLSAKDDENLLELSAAAKALPNEVVVVTIKDDESKDLRTTTGVELKVLQAVIPTWCATMAIIAVFVVGRAVIQRLEHNHN